MTQEIATTPKQEVQRSNGGPEATRASLVYRPATDIYESADDVVLVADMPGVGPDDIEVSLERRVLTIRGHARPPAPEGFRQAYAEYGVGDYERVFTLSDDIDQEKIEASQNAGVLTLRLPKAAATKPRKIAVQAS